MITETSPGLAYDMGTAVFSDDRVYRYRLTRTLDTAPGPRCLFIMLNPSTADAFVLDPTVRRCINFARREGCSTLEVVNLFALRSTDPRALYEHDDPVGPDNLIQILEATERADIVVAAWGHHAAKMAQTVSNPEAWLDEIPMVCLGKTKAGAPRHPLYVHSDTPLIPYP